jgi:hypothetical protein
MARDSGEQLDPARGQRSQRRPRVNYRDLLAAIRENDDPNPDTPEAAGSGQRKRVPATADPQQPAAQAEAPEAGLAKRQRTSKAPAQAAPHDATTELEAEAPEAGPSSAAAAAAAAADDSPCQQHHQQQPPGKQRQKRQRVLVDVHGGASTRMQHPEPEEVENEYERQASPLCS